MKKRLFVLLTVMVLLVTMAATAFAAKPTATLVSKYKNQTVKAGKTISFWFKLDSGSYEKKDDAFRAKLGVLIVKDGATKGAANWVWTGKQTYKLRAKIQKAAEAGKYTVKYTTYYRSKEAAAWKKAKTQSTKFTVKK